jgi:lysozyme
MKTSAAGIQAIMLREGFETVGYADSRGIPTNGCGHAATGGPPKVWVGQVWTTATVLSVLADDLAKEEAAINAAVKVPLTQNQFDALVSITFNIGVPGMLGSSFLKELNAGNYQECAKDFMNWTTPKSLTGRRQGEQAQFLRPDTPEAVTTPAQGSIAWIQARLNQKGAATPLLTVDGDLGPATIAAVKEFQGANGLVMDGLVGPKTLAVLAAG